MAVSRHAPWKPTAINLGIPFLYAQLAAQIVRRRRASTSAVMGAWHTETVYAVTDLGFDDIRARQLAEIIRDHWSIENEVHWVRDATFTGNRSQIRRQRAGGHGHPAQFRPRPPPSGWPHQHRRRLPTHQPPPYLSR
jgi:hypothetical protein